MPRSHRILTAALAGALAAVAAGRSLGWQQPARAAGRTPLTVEFAIGEPYRWLGGDRFRMDVAPVILHDRTFLPVRYVAEPLGGQVDWDPQDRRVDVTWSGHRLSLWVDRPVAELDGAMVAIDANPQVAPVIRDGRTLLPARFVAERMGAQVSWDPVQQRVRITPPASLPPALPAHFQRGISYAAYTWNVLLSRESDQRLAELPRVGVEWVALIPVWYQTDATSHDIRPVPYDTPTDESVRHAVAQLHARGIRVLLKPFVDSQDGTWRARIRPRDRAAWFRAYKEFILHYARLAQELGVAGLCIGTELDFSTGDEAAWRDIIAAVRAVYRGPLVYAANYTDYQRVRFWDALDYIGIDAYFPLAQNPDASLDELRAGWRRAADQVEQWWLATGQKKPVIFTEVGLPSYTGAAQSPGSWDLGTEPNMRLQADAYQAAFEELSGRPWLQGMYWWWWDNPSTADWGGGPQNIGYTPRDKLAEGVLAQWYRR